MNLGAFLSGTKWLKALSNKSHMIFSPFYQQRVSQSKQVLIWWSLKSHLSALQVPPHGSLAADSQSSVVKHAQEEQHQA